MSPVFLELELPDPGPYTPFSLLGPELMNLDREALGPALSPQPRPEIISISHH